MTDASIASKKTRKFQTNAFRQENLAYDPQRDEFICPAQKPLKLENIKVEYTKSLYPQTIHHYRARGCGKCPLRPKCTKARRNREMAVNGNLWRNRDAARQNLNSELGKKLRSLRSVEVESVFGQLKRNRGFRRFHLRGYEKVNTELGIVCIAHNVARLAAN